jgi:hypothetical protein
MRGCLTGQCLLIFYARPREQFTVSGEMSFQYTTGKTNDAERSTLVCLNPKKRILVCGEERNKHINYSGQLLNR